MKNTKSGLILMDALCTEVFSLGAGLILLPFWKLQADWLLLAGAVLILIAAFALWERWPAASSAVLGGCALLALFAVLVTGKWDEIFSAAVEYTRWTIRETSRGEPQFPVLLAAALPIALVFWILMRRLPLLWIVTPLSAVLIAVKVLFLPEGWLPPFLLLCAGNFLFLPRISAKAEGRLQAQLLAAILVIPILGFSLWFGPRSNGEWRSVSLGYLVQDVRDLWEFHWGKLPTFPGFSMRSMGLQPEGNRLGGDIDPGDSTLLSSEKRLLLRGQVFDTYTGKSWEDGPDRNYGSFRLDSPVWQGRRKNAFGQDRPDTDRIALLDGMTVKVDANIRSYLNTQVLFLPYRTETLKPFQSSGELYFDLQGEAYWSSRPKSGSEYHVEAVAWDFQSESFDQDMLLLESSLSEDDAFWEQASEQCLQLPDALPRWVKDLAGETTADGASPYEKAIALRDYLKNSCEYTLTPGSPDPDTDFVAAFLTDRRGYCTYYASALTVLCRCAGIPARYVTGYGMIPDGGRFKATPATAHAWTEIYLKNIGWVPLDALSQNIFEEDAEISEEDSGGGQNSIPTPAPTPSAPAEAVPPLEKEQSADFTGLLWLIPGPVLLGGILIFRRLRRETYQERRLRRKFPQPEQAAEHCYSELLRLLKLIRLQPQTGETLLTFWQRIEKLLPEAMDWSFIGELMNRLRFGHISPSDEEIALLCGAIRLLAPHARKRLGILGWFFV